MTRKSPRRERGANLVETAFALPVVLLVLFGVVEFGRFLSMSQGVSTAARESARYGMAVGMSDNSLPRYTDCDEIVEAGIALSGLGDVVAVDFSVSYQDDTGTTVADCDTSDSTYPDPSPSVVDDGDVIVVSVSRSFDTIVPFAEIVLPSEVAATDQRTIFLTS